MIPTPHSPDLAARAHLDLGRVARIALVSALLAAVATGAGCARESESRNLAVLGPVLEGKGAASVNPDRFRRPVVVIADGRESDRTAADDFPR